MRQRDYLAHFVRADYVKCRGISGMRYVVSSNEMRRCDNNTITEFKIPSMVLMERAALAVAEEIMRNYSGIRVLILAGCGNNGGDGLAIGRLLLQQNYDVTCVLLGETERCSEQTACQMEILQKYGLEIGCNLPDEEYDIIVDAIFGIGLTREITGKYAEAIEYINRSGADTVSVDVPSGICSDTGKIMGTAVKADMTVTFAYIKKGIVLYPGAEYAGKIICRDIGITKESFLGQYPSCFTYDKEDFIRLPLRPADGNKGTFGKVLLIAGSKNMSGACLLAGESIYRTGAGLVRIMTVEENRILLQDKLPEAVLVTYNAEQYPKQELEESVAWADCIAVGPGLSQNKVAEEIVETILHSAKPLVLDADAINIIARNTSYQRLLKEKNNVILTPHIGEFARLSGKTTTEIKSNIIETAHTFAREYDVILVCKDARTIVCNAEEQIYINTSGNAGMATAGAGDVLTGIIAGLVAQRMELYEAAALGVYIHGMAGDMAAQKYNEYYLMAGTLIEQLQYILKKDE